MNLKVFQSKPKFTLASLQAEVFVWETTLWEPGVYSYINH